MNTLKTISSLIMTVAISTQLCAASYKGYVYDDETKVGTVTASAGKANKNGECKISVKVKIGKKSYKASDKIEFSDGDSVSLENSKLGSFDLTLSDGTIEGSVGNYSVSSESYSGDADAWLDGEFTFTIEGYPSYDGNGEVLDDLLPDGETITASNGKWKTEKAYGPKIKKVDGEKEIVVKGDTNHAALKLSYNKKKGTVSGSFKVYVVTYNKNDEYSKIKAYSYKVKGEVSDGAVVGTATNKKLGDLSFSIE